MPSFVRDYVVKPVGKWSSTHSHMGSATHPFEQTRDSGDVVLTLWEAPLSWRCCTVSAMQQAFVTLCWDPLMDKRTGSVSTGHLLSNWWSHCDCPYRRGCIQGWGCIPPWRAVKKKSSSAIYCVLSRTKQLETEHRYSMWSKLMLKYIVKFWEILKHVFFGIPLKWW